MTKKFVLASGSQIRADLLRNAGLDFTTIVARVDEETVKDSLAAESASPRDVADVLAELKARKISEKHPDALVLGCDQVLDFDNVVFSKPETQDDALAQLKTLRGKTHRLLSAAVLYHQARPVWRHVGTVRLHMRDASDEYLQTYVARNWESVRFSVGSYKLEEEGVRLFHRIEGDYFNVLGLPLLELLAHLTLTGEIEG